MDKCAPQLVVQQIDLKDFRCFQEKTIFFDAPITIIEGDNGSGKTTLIEALFYAAHMHSFRTHKNKEIIRETAECFFIRLGLTPLQDYDSTNTLQIGCSKIGKRVKINNETITSYQQIMPHYRAICVMEDDMRLVQQGPHERRVFIDQSLLLFEPTLAALFKKFRTILMQRNQAIERRMHKNAELHELLTEQLFVVSHEIQQKRVHFLESIQQELKQLVEDFDMPFSISCTYENAHNLCGFESASSFYHQNTDLFARETYLGRSLFGAHLDDITIMYHQKNARFFASRGQQKFILLLLKMAIIRRLFSTFGLVPLVFLLDDFITDFDHKRLSILLEMVSNLPVQLIFTAPSGAADNIRSWPSDTRRISI